MNIIKENKFISLLIFSIVWFLFLQFIFENSYEVIDPCASTPSTEFSNIAILIPVVLSILFIYLYNLVANNLPKNKKYLYTIIVLILLPLIFAIVGYKFLDNDFVKSTIRETSLHNSVYSKDCYNDIVINSSALYFLNSILIFIFSYILIRLLTKKGNI